MAKEPQTAEQLFAAYETLADDEKKLLELLAVAYTELWSQELERAVKTLQLKRNGKTLGEALRNAGLADFKAPYGSSAKGWSCATSTLAELIARRLVRENRFDAVAKLVEQCAPLPRSYYANVKYHFNSVQQLIRAVRIAFHRQDFARIHEYYEMLHGAGRYLLGPTLMAQWGDPAVIYGRICGDPFDKEWFLALPASVVDATLPNIAKPYVEQWQERNDEVLELLADGCDGKLGRAVPASWGYLLAQWHLLRGDFKTCLTVLERYPSHGLKGCATLLQEGLDAGIASFEACLADYRKQQGKRKIALPGFSGAMHLVALWLRNGSGDAREAEALLLQWQKHPPDCALKSSIAQVPGLLENHKGAAGAFVGTLNFAAQNWHTLPRDFVLMYLLAAWLERDSARTHSKAALDCAMQANRMGYAWAAEELSALVAGLEPGLEELKAEADAFEQARGMTLLARRFHFEESWERVLRSLANFGATPPSAGEETGKPAAEMRLVWWVWKKPQYRYNHTLPYTLELREQKRGGKGWAKGKTVTFKRLSELSAEGVPWLLEQDHLLARHIMQDRYTNGYILGERGWLALAGHPHLQWADSCQPMEVVAAKPELVVKKLKGDQVQIHLQPAFDENQQILIWPETPTRLKVAEITAEHQRIRNALGASGITVPLAARERVLEALGAVSSLVTVHSDIGGAVGESEAVAADPQTRVHLLPEGEGLRVELLVRPFGEVGPFYPPSTGGKALFVELEGKRLHTERQLKDERKRAEALAEACPVLQEQPPYQDFAWQLDEPEPCLELLLQLQALGETVRVEWPQGERFKLAGMAGLKQFQVKVRASRDWFAVDGQVTLDDGLVLNMQRLLALMGQSEGRFIRLDDGRFLALTDAFRKRLADIDALAESHGKERRIHALAAPLLEELAEEAGEFVSDKAWRERIARLRNAEALQPVLPSNLQAELRDYQVEGYNWLSRLAAWGVGACLADDMGLGKTLQALALMLQRAPEGPSLVVAPTSVCANWHSEALRFAPSLNVQILGAGDRKNLIESLGPMDLLVCSYALLQQASVSELLTEKAWRTIILDEAQAIKNMATKRSQASMNLQGDFKLITTGTPVENHLGELWNLFRFINPGLLGSLESFNQRFAGPIERGDKDARQRLKRIVQPFVLRRLKTQVLDELPARTEIQLEVELSEQERAFYEALRRRTMAELEDSGGEPQGEKHLKVLAAIMKLRRACCHSALVAPDLGLSSSKLTLFGEVLEELLDNRHKALVFSQFVDHLGLIRAYLDDKGIRYQYLDGSTPAADRKKRVDAFQAGQGDVFLISLKAGGVGLNLTAADYVIHMDPWWNPAVEDQASDRAHRMGQQRPVTIYRLVAKGTIEEKIVALHRHKRDLADSVLSGGETSGKIGTDELLRLIREM
jgi:superfamily II DNA or RNA helicase